MGADFVLIGAVIPHRKNSEGKFEVLTDTELAVKIALKRLEATTTEDLADTQYFESLYDDMTDDDGELQRHLYVEAVADMVKEFVEAYDSREGAIITFDVPRLFTGGTTWGDEPTEIFGVVAGVSELQVFQAPLTDEEIGEYVKTDWAAVVW